MKIRSKLNELRITCLYYVFRLSPIKRNKVVFCNYVGKGYGCNPKYIAEGILRKNKGWDLVWLINSIDAKFPTGIRSVKYESVKAIYELATAGVWVDNQRKLSYNRKRKSQYFIETWHGGGGPIKKLGADNPKNFNDKPYENTSRHMDRIVNVMISNSTSCTKVYRSAFLYTGEVLECGYPRNDILINDWQKMRPKVYEYFNLSVQRKTVLYAPTYRNNRNLDTYQLDMSRLLKNLTNKFGGSWTLLMRLHPTMLQRAEEVYYSDNIINASAYDDMQELLAACDVLVSDYSSVISEFALTGKPIFLFATDISEYAIERDFYVDYYSLPFSIAENNEQLAENIQNFQEDEYANKVTNYLQQVGMREYGNAAYKVVNLIEDWIENS